MIDLSIPNTKNLDVSSNEYRTKYSVQRIIDKLYANDYVLKLIYNKIFSNFSIYEWQHDLEYEYGDIVWFLDNDKELHILRCDKNKSSDDLSLYSSSENSFDDFGWKDMNPDIDILNDYGILAKIDLYVSKIFKLHSEDTSYHKFGKISLDDTSKNSLYNKVAERDVLNLDSSRNTFLFPYLTVTLKNNSNGSIIDGFCRKYENGLLEYDITFRLGYVGFLQIDSEYKISANILTCNDFNPSDDRSMDKYFYQISDMDIFLAKKIEKTYDLELGLTVHKNRNDYINVYSAVIDFANCAAVNSILLYFEYLNTNYMVFCSDMISQVRNANSLALNPSPNAITFCLKQKGLITALLVTYPNMNNFEYSGLNALSTPLVSNTFHCKIIGKGKPK